MPLLVPALCKVSAKGWLGVACTGRGVEGKKEGNTRNGKEKGEKKERKSHLKLHDILGIMIASEFSIFTSAIF